MKKLCAFSTVTHELAVLKIFAILPKYPTFQGAFFVFSKLEFLHNISVLIWKKTGDKSVQLVRGSFLSKYFLQNPYFKEATVGSLVPIYFFLVAKVGLFSEDIVSIVTCLWLPFLKFSFSEKATQICAIFLMVLTPKNKQNIFLILPYRMGELGILLFTRKKNLPSFVYV